MIPIVETTAKVMVSAVVLLLLAVQEPRMEGRVQRDRWLEEGGQVWPERYKSNVLFLGLLMWGPSL